MPQAQYWRAAGISTWGGGELAISALHLCNAAGVRVDGGATLACTHAPDTGALSNLTDDDLSVTVSWSRSKYAASGFAITWTLAAPASVGALLVGSADSIQTWIDAIELQYSADGIVWQTMRGALAVVGSGAIWPGARAMRLLSGMALAEKAALWMRLDADVDNTTIIDDTGINTPVALGAVVLSATDYVSGGASAFFNSADGNAIKVALPTAGHPLNLHGYDFTISMDVRYFGGSPTDTGAYLFVWGGAWNVAWADVSVAVYPGGQINVAMRSTAAGDGDPPDIANYEAIGPRLPVGTWTRIQLRRSGPRFTLQFDNTVVWSKTDNRHLKPTLSAIGFGGSHTSDNGMPKQCLSGYIDNVIVVVGASPNTLDADVQRGFVGRIRSSYDPVRLAASSAVGAHHMQYQPGWVAQDTEFGGAGHYPFKVEGLPTSQKARVTLLRARDKALARQTWSKADGTGAFTGLDMGTKFIAVAQDPSGLMHPCGAEHYPELPEGA